MDNYDDIINLPHPEPTNHKRMSMYQRAAQFSPFAALSGYEEAIRKAQEEMEEKIRQKDSPVLESDDD